MTDQMKELFARGPRTLMAFYIILGTVFSNTTLLFGGMMFSMFILVFKANRDKAFVMAIAAEFGFVIMGVFLR